MTIQLRSPSGGTNATREMQLAQPLELLVISNDKQFLEDAKDFYSNKAATTTGKSLYSVKALARHELSDLLPVEETNGSYILSAQTATSSQILLYDLREDLPKGLSVLERYLLRNQKCFAIATIEESSLDHLLNNPTWLSLQRNVSGLPLTQNYRISSKEFQRHFKRISSEVLTEECLSIIRDLKSDYLEVTKRISPHPTEFGNFSKEIREQSPTVLVRAALDRIAEFDPDETRRLLEQIQPTEGGHSVPQHVYPPFEQLERLSQEKVIPIMRGIADPNAALYIHVPYCPGRDACKFCDYTTLRASEMGGAPKYLDLLRREVQLIHSLTGWTSVIPEGIHIGGGTPSILPVELIITLGKLLEDFFPAYKKNAQLSFEVSPGTTHPDKLDAFKEIGATRASVGLQSVIDMGLLRWFNRIYSTETGQKAVDLLLKRWPTNTNVDLIYGLPGQAFKSWERDLEAVLKLGVPSITIYDLRISPRTRFSEDQKFPTQYEIMVMQVMATQRFLESGYTQISDNHFVKSPEGQPYAYKEFKKRGGNLLGIGLSSYSMYPGIVYFNEGGKDPHDLENIDRYAASVEEGRLPVEVGKILSPAEQMSLFVIQGLKLSGAYKAANGINLDHFRGRFGRTIYNAFPHVPFLENRGLLKLNDGHLGLTPSGLAFEPQVLKTFYHR